MFSSINLLRTIMMTNRKCNSTIILNCSDSFLAVAGGLLEWIKSSGHSFLELVVRTSAVEVSHPKMYSDLS